MAAIPPYTTGTATVTSGSAIVTGTGTAWNIGVVNGGEFSRLGLSIPIASIDSATQLTLSYAAPAGMAGTGAYAISLARAGAADAVTANARLAQLVSQLQGFSPFFQSLIDDIDQAAFRTSIAAQEALSYVPVNKAGDSGLGNMTATAWLLDAAAYFSKIGPDPILNFDATDFIGFTRATNTFNFAIGGANKLTLNSLGAILPALIASGGAHLDVTPVTVAIASGAAYIIGTTSGLLLVTDYTTGSTALYLLGGANVVLVGQSGTSFGVGAGLISAGYDSTNTRYFLFNTSGATRTICPLFVRTRGFI